MAGFEIYDIYYDYHCEGCAKSESVLVRTSHKYKEIYYLEPTAASSGVPSAIFNLGEEKVLLIRYWVSGFRSLITTARQ